MGHVRDLPNHEKPREKALQFGIRNLSTTELLAIVLRTGVKGKSVLETSQNLLQQAGEVDGISKMSVMELSRFEGVGKVKALELLCAFELSRRVAYEHVQEGRLLDQPEKIVDWLRHEIAFSMQEKFLVVFLNTQLQLLSYKVLFQGTLDGTEVFPREIFKEAILQNSKSILLAHNHPSGSLTPSKQDIILTKRMAYLGEMMQIEVVDHIIVTSNGYLSFVREGLME